MQINLREICAINKYTASKERTRYYLNGVFVHSDKEYVYFVATDGHRMVVHRVTNADGMDWKFIIPRTLLEKFKFSKRDADFADLFYSDGSVIIARDGGHQIEKEVDGTFPEYIQVRPVDDGKIEPALFNGQYCADFDALAKIFGGAAVLTPRGQNPALVTFGRDDIYGVLMPMRDNKMPFASKAPF